MNYIDQTWDLGAVVIRVRIESDQPLPADLVRDVSPIVAAIETFVSNRLPETAES